MIPRFVPDRDHPATRICYNEHRHHTGAALLLIAATLALAWFILHQPAVSVNGSTFHPYEPYFWYACLPLTLLLCHYPLCLHFRHPPALICDTNGLSVYNRYGVLSGQWYWTEITAARALLHGVSGSSLQLDLTTHGTWPPPGAPPDACPLAAIILTAAPAIHSECHTLAIANDHLPRILEQIADYIQHLPPHAIAIHRKFQTRRVAEDSTRLYGAGFPKKWLRHFLGCPVRRRNTV